MNKQTLSTESATGPRVFERDGFLVCIEHNADPNALEEYIKLMSDEPMGSERFFAYERGDWQYIGVCVSIRKQTSSNWADGGLEVGRASVWGVESDAGDYLAELEREEIAEAFAEVERLKVALCGKG